MQAEPSCSSLRRDEPSVAAIKPYFKLRLGGSRSVVTGKFLKDTLYNSSNRRHDSNLPSLEPTRSLDSNSISSRSTDSSLNQEKVRIMGRGGAGARRRNYTKTVIPSSPPMIEMRPLHAPESVQEPVLRNLGRGGLGSRPQGIRGKGKAVDTTSHKRKKSKYLKRSLSFDRELRSKSPESQLSTISTIHFAGETGLPPPDFFKVTKKRSQQTSLVATTTNEPDVEERDLNPTTSPRSSRNTSSAAVTPTTSQSNLASNVKARRRERGFSMLLSVFQQDGTRKPDSGPLPPSTLDPSQITLTSIETDPSYFFHGSGSPPPTPPCSQETDSMTESSYSTQLGSSLSSFQREPSPSSIPPSQKDEFDNCQEVELDEPLSSSSSSPQQQQQHDHPPPTTKRREDDVPLTLHHGLGMHLSASEADALGSPPCSPFLQERIPFVPTYPPPTIFEVEEVESKGKQEEPELSWTGEWNAGMVEVMRALRELR